MENFWYHIRFWWLAYMTSYFYKDHSLDPPDGDVLLYENFKDNKFHYDWDYPSWLYQPWTDLSKEKIMFKDSQMRITDNTLIMTTDVNNVQGEPAIKSGEITSTRFLNRTYGFYECCMRVCGEWDAFWLWLSDNQYANVKRYEIDIMEMECEGTNAFTITVHDWGFDGKNGKIIGTRKFKLRRSLTENYHVFAANWKQDSISFYLDGILLWKYTGEIPNSKCFLWVNNSYKGGQLPVSNYVKQIRVQKEKT